MAGSVSDAMHTRFTADAPIGVKIDNPAIKIMQRVCGANIYTGSGFTVIAAKYRKHSFVVRELTALDVFHPRTIYTDRNIVFRFTRDRACMASDTLPAIH